MISSKKKIRYPKDNKHAEYMKWLWEQRRKDLNNLKKEIYGQNKRLATVGVKIEGEQYGISININKHGEIKESIGKLR